VTAPVVLGSAQELATTVATRLLSVLASAQAEGRDPHVALTGGTIAEAIHREVARLSPGSGVDWTRVHLWWGDERFVEAGSPERNAGQARAAFIDAVGVPDAHVHEVATTEQAADVDAAAASYAEEVRTHGSGAFDLVMLGVGPDGHVASLFPGFPQVHVDDAIAVGVTESPKPPPERVSLTFPALNRTRATWFVVSGDGKAEAVARALDPASTTVEETPATGAHGGEETVWFLDRDAASRLPG
jgi:6-phosphogluconolactonase